MYSLADREALLRWTEIFGNINMKCGPATLSHTRVGSITDINFKILVSNYWLCCR